MLVNNLLNDVSVLSESWDNNNHIWKRNFYDTATDTRYPYAFLRFLAERKRNINVLEVTRGVPYKALELSNTDRFRDHGDMLVYGVEKGKHDAPVIQSYWVSDRDWVQTAIELEHHNAVDHRNMLRWIVKSPSREPRDLMRAYADFSPFIRFIGDDWVEGINRHAKTSGGFDIAFLDLTEVVNRVDLINAVQCALIPSGKAFMPISWWRPASRERGIEEISLIRDVVSVDGTERLLSEYLGELPGFSIMTSAGVEVLIVENGNGANLNISKIEEIDRDISTYGSPFYLQSAVKITWKPV